MDLRKGISLDFKFTYRKTKKAADLADYVQDRFAKLEKFELKPVHVNVTFSAERHDCCVLVFIQGSEISFRAEAKSDSFPDAIDLVVAKLVKQMARKKSRVQDHLVYENSRRGKWDRAS